MYCAPMLAVRDVEASSRWYQSLLGLASGHGGPEFEMLMDGTALLLVLHRPDGGEHQGGAGEAGGGGAPGRGVRLHMGVEDVRAVHARAVEMGARVLGEPHYNSNARATQFSLRDPDGYALVVSEWRS